MKYKIIILTLTTFLLSCSEKLDHATALSYYGEIGQTSVSEINSYKEFMEISNQSFKKAIENSPQKLDSLSLMAFKSAYQKFIAQLDTDLIKINRLKEVDPEINLKENFVKYIVFADTSFKNLMPMIFDLLEKGMETMTEEQKQKILQLKEATDNEQKQRTKIDELSEEFMIKHKIEYKEVEKYGM